MGEQKERLFALEVPDTTGAFFRMYKAVQPRLVTEFVYRHAPSNQKAIVYMSLERADDSVKPDKEVHGVNEALAPIGVVATDVTSNELAKTHARYLVGGRPGEIIGERIIRFEFPETPGSLAPFLSALRDDWFITMLHYRNHGGQVGKVLAGVKVPSGQEAAFDKVLQNIEEAHSITFYDETENPIYMKYMR